MDKISPNREALDYFQYLEVALFTKIFAHLNWSDLSTCAHVSKFWKMHADEQRYSKKGLTKCFECVCDQLLKKPLHLHQAIAHLHWEFPSYQGCYFDMYFGFYAHKTPTSIEEESSLHVAYIFPNKHSEKYRVQTDGQGIMTYHQGLVPLLPDWNAFFFCDSFLPFVTNKPIDQVLHRVFEKTIGKFSFKKN